MNSYSQDCIQRLRHKANALRQGVVQCIGVGCAGHLGGSCSAADLVAALYFYKMKHNPQDPHMPDRDRFLLSKGHVAILQYAALAEAGYFPKEALKHTKELGAMLQGHPDVRKTPGIEAGTGSLGQGLSIGLGMALGLRLDGIPARVYVLLGDGELDEGQVWEAAMAASAYGAANLIAIVDNNGMQATGRLEDRLDSGDLGEKWRSFGWNVLEINGHDMAQILSALDQADQAEVPTVILAHTVKGKGIHFAENVAAYHNGILTEETYAMAMEDLRKEEG